MKERILNLIGKWPIILAFIPLFFAILFVLAAAQTLVETPDWLKLVFGLIAAFFLFAARAVMRSLERAQPEEEAEEQKPNP
jgi:hypothetical protein